MTKKLSEKKLKALLDRKGARTMAEIPKDVLTALNDGLIETKNLVEILAIDMEKLLHNALLDVGAKKEREKILSSFALISDEGFNRRMKEGGAIILRGFGKRKSPQAMLNKLATHTSDTVRSWACYALVGADEDVPLQQRLVRAKVFAADSHMSVRECAWAAFRPHIAVELKTALKLLKPWVKDSDPNIRRCAIEGTRPRGVWTAHIALLKENPAMALPLLEVVKSDPSRYVQNAVANWLNDASKSQPSWVEQLCKRWKAVSPTKATQYIVRRGLRTISKKGS